MLDTLDQMGMSLLLLGQKRNVYQVLEMMVEMFLHLLKYTEKMLQPASLVEKRPKALCDSSYCANIPVASVEFS